ncbi:hypothetical protein V5S96_03545 [Corynebacterium mastitidis]|uniref:DUF2567 domain-containing protein n=1 Tax=Corynebacterium mastitidis TaxID=161890 RepID=A0ABU8NWP3_9CORY
MVGTEDAEGAAGTESAEGAARRSDRQPPGRAAGSARSVVSSASAVVALAAPLFLALGAAWGMAYPTYRGTLLAGGAVSVAAPQGGEFSSWIALVLGAGALSAALAIGFFLRLGRARGVAMQVWLALVSGAGGLVTYECGVGLARWRTPVPNPDAVRPGDTVEVLAAVGLGAPISLVFPAFMAALAYWSCLLVAPGDAEDRRAEASDTSGDYNRGTETYL